MLDSYRLIGTGLSVVAILSILGWVYYEIQKAAVLENENAQLRIQLKEEKEFNEAYSKQRDSDFETIIENAKISATIRKSNIIDFSQYDNRPASELLKEAVRKVK